MTHIHASAIIDCNAQLDSTVVIGPYAVIGPHVRIGAHTTVGAHSVIEGHTTIGSSNRIGHFAALGGLPQDMKYQGEETRLEIGDRNTIREFTSIHTGTAQGAGLTRVGHDNWIMAYVHIAHDCLIGSHTVLANNAQIAGHVQVHDWAILGGMTGVHQHVRIGTHAMLGGASSLAQDVPPFVIASGHRAAPYGIHIEGLRRRGFATEVISALRAAYRILYKSGLPLDQAKPRLAELAGQSSAAAPWVRTLLDFIESAQRGIIH
ncbi:Acyl-(acyl-carrier-protein)--UDP-N-acetylglucosamine O-acyltransferase (UDP-N-acetylglucosamine acyltransferase) [Candidatus Glomeribacter gigasporarum BEG34]|uniref:Acyl-[acyl-carrier-protein]--UDP-N-acetylglucosamine O-acyltransferase n=1 Tax=Candidatus Glomeribacter gigasporarum BEG34 TaxID=1070319 RepID=G2J9U5_9BURK|nr:acyl-ACP--UDP-N-acetylglucosamine O-acyltransferase [Candidatus Glomeribacter gigasporarum]CCD29542.1 Acyl-(acyl-carrier-protein)--UDP-N-acetylglucosamine O-acyltransferase (UDP-N-acetylglucosamine acyltransferase) [Candidatus Glomeribacter gigasporarum BEG34]